MPVKKNPTVSDTLEALEIVAVLERIAFERGRQHAIAGYPMNWDTVSELLKDLEHIVSGLPRDDEGYRAFDLDDSCKRGYGYGERQAAAQGLPAADAGRDDDAPAMAYGDPWVRR